MKSESLTFRLDVGTKDRIDAAFSKLPYRPSLTAIIERGINLAIKEAEEAILLIAKPSRAALSDRQYLEKIADQVIARNSKIDAAISRPGYPRPEIENRSSEEPCQARGSGEMQDEDAIHLPTFSKAETSREASPAAETESGQSGAVVVSACPALIDDCGGGV